MHHEYNALLNVEIGKIVAEQSGKYDNLLDGVKKMKLRSFGHVVGAK